MSQDAGSMTWYEEFYAAIDALDITFLDRLCSDDTRVRLANHEQAVGRKAVREALEHFWSTIAGMRHSFVNVIEQGDETLLEAIVEYTRLDQSKVSMPVATVIVRRDDLVTEQRIYIDLAPLHEGGAGTEGVS